MTPRPNEKSQQYLHFSKSEMWVGWGNLILVVSVRIEFVTDRLGCVRARAGRVWGGTDPLVNLSILLLVQLHILCVLRSLKRFGERQELGFPKNVFISLWHFSILKKKIFSLKFCQVQALMRASLFRCKATVFDTPYQQIAELKLVNTDDCLVNNVSSTSHSYEFPFESLYSV